MIGAIAGDIIGSTYEILNTKKKYTKENVWKTSFKIYFDNQWV